MERTCFNTELSEKNVGQEVTLIGWVSKKRNLGSIAFIDLRDRSGIMQITVNDANILPDVRNEYVISVKGVVGLRSNPNPNLPTGKILPLSNTIYDFNQEKQLDSKLVYDINYVLNGTGFRKVASLKSVDACIDIYTDRPGIQLYKSSKHVCLEAQMFPDAIHFKHFPSPILKKDAAFYSKTAYHFKSN